LVHFVDDEGNPVHVGLNVLYKNYNARFFLYEGTPLILIPKTSLMLMNFDTQAKKVYYFTYKDYEELMNKGLSKDKTIRLHVKDIAEIDDPKKLLGI